MATLQGRAIKDTYKDLLQVSNSNIGVDNTLRTVEDGEGTSSALKISTAGVQVNGTLDVTGAVTGVPQVTYRGTYSGSTSYVKDDVVVHLGSSYIAKAATSGNAPTNSTYWGLLASKGTDGTDGTDGVNGTNGTNGTNGNNGVSVTNAQINSSGRLILTLSTGTTIDCGVAKGADGSDGSDGADGSTPSLGIINVGTNKIGIGGTPSLSDAYPLQVMGGAHFGWFKANNQTGAALALENTNTNSDGLGLAFISNNTSTNTSDDRADLEFRHTTGAGNFYMTFKDAQAPTTTRKAVALGSDGHWRPVQDNTQLLGSSGFRWSQLYAGTTTINTSDENLKQDIQDFSEAEKRVAIALKGMMKTFRFKDAVAEKGDDARIHSGVIAQQVAGAFSAEGLDAHRYALFCHDIWYTPKVDPNCGPIQYKEPPENVECDRHEAYSIRYSELFAFIISAL